MATSDGGMVGSHDDSVHGDLFFPPFVRQRPPPMAEPEIVTFDDPVPPESPMTFGYGATSPNTPRDLPPWRPTPDPKPRFGGELIVIAVLLLAIFVTQLVALHENARTRCAATATTAEARRRC